MSTEALPLSVLVDRAAGDGERDRAFVRSFTGWFVERAPRITLPMVERLGLRDVVVTFRMKDRVRLVITGAPPDDLPGEITCTVDERDFPFVEVGVLPADRDDPYEFCTLDYALAGRRVAVTAGAVAGQQGALMVSATIGNDQEHRVRLDTGRVVTLSGEVLRFLD